MIFKDLKPGALLRSIKNEKTSWLVLGHTSSRRGDTVVEMLNLQTKLIVKVTLDFVIEAGILELYETSGDARQGDEAA